MKKTPEQMKEGKSGAGCAATVRRPSRPDEVYEAHEGETIYSLLDRNGFRLDAPCAGQGRCGKCRLKVSGRASPMEKKEEKLLGPQTGERLACQAKILGDVFVELPEESRFSSVAGLGQSEPYEIDPPLKLKKPPLPDRQDGTDLMRLWELKKANIAALNQLAGLDAAKEAPRLVLWGDELLSAGPLEREEGLLAAAVDIGTTGLALALIDVLTGTVVAQGTALNPQTSCGGDVVSRMTLAAEGPKQLEHLQSLVLGGIGALALETAGRNAERIMAMTVAANTTMTYLLAGIQPMGLARAPYRPVFAQSLDLSHLSGRLHISGQAKIFTAPAISAYVGGDISAGMLAVGLAKLPGTVLYIDIGTNGEIVLSHKGRPGPALEGMNIIRGQRATVGAVDSFEMSPDFQHKFTTIAGAPATGICGSGLIDLTAALVRRGLIDSSGRMKPPKEMPPDAPHLAGLSEGRFRFADDVFLDQKDVRQVQLAKGAIAAGVEMLLARVGLTENDLDEIVIAGAFGFHLKTESLLAIGLIPSSYKGPVRFVGNASLAGAARMLLSSSALDDLRELAHETQALELGLEPDFQKVFVRHLKF